MKKYVILLLTLLLLLSVAACGKTNRELDPNAVLTDSDVPLDLGAELWDFGESQTEEAF